MAGRSQSVDNEFPQLLVPATGQAASSRLSMSDEPAGKPRVRVVPACAVVPSCACAARTIAMLERFYDTSGGHPRMPRFGPCRSLLPQRGGKGDARRQFLSTWISIG